MKALIYLFLGLHLFYACGYGQSVPNNTSDNEELKRIYKEDQADRKSPAINWKVVGKRDNAREARVYQLLDSAKVKTALDYRNAAMVFQHGGDTTASHMAVKMMRKAVQLDPAMNKWLLAAAIDRHLMSKDEPQIYGTQYRRSGANEPWVLYRIDTTVVSDSERSEYNVPSLMATKRRLKFMNKRKLFELIDEGQSVDSIVNLIKVADVENCEFNITQNAINSFGYQLMRLDRNREALEIFRLNTILYPDGYNTHDSYGECLFKLEKYELSREAYNKSISLNPKNENAEKMVREINRKIGNVN